MISIKNKKAKSFNIIHQALLSLLFLGLSFQSFAEVALYPPPDITITCDYWFPFNSNNPNQYVDAFDDHFGEIVGGQSYRKKIYLQDRVCPAHPKFNEYGPANPLDDPCYDDFYNIYWGYDGYITDYPTSYLAQNIVSHLHCGRGDLIREWRLVIYPNSPPLATQRITIISCREFHVPTACWRFTAGDVGTCDLINSGTGLSYKTKLVEWPCDVEITTCPQDAPDAFEPDNLPVFFDEDREPRLANDRCSLLAASYEDNVFTFVDSACMKIFRKWSVIDWCLYEDYNNGTYFGEYRWSRTQVIVLSNQDGPDLGDCEDRTVCGYGDPDSSGGEECVGKIEVRPDISDDCTALSQLNIDYKIDLFNDGSYDRLGYNAKQGSNYPFPNPNNLPVRVFPDSLPNADGLYPVGTHKVFWAAEDGCGNAASCSYLLTVEDCKPPTAYCLPGISTIPMVPQAGGYMDIWALDFNLGSTDNCSPDSLLRYSFSDDPTDISRRYFCEDVAGGDSIMLTVYVWDEAGNFSTCSIAALFINDCGDQAYATVSGSISNELEQAMANVMVRLNGDSTIEEMTNTAGEYAFDPQLIGNTYSIAPEKNDDPLNGISTFDLILISRHILGNSLLDSPYKMIAADVNNSGDITTFDLVELRKLILQIDSTFANNTSWRFVLANYAFPDEANPFNETFPEIYTIDSLSSDEESAFVAIKTGDVDCSAQLQSGDLTTNRNGLDKWFLELDDKRVSKGEMFSIDIKLAEAEALLGFQFSLSFDSEQLTFNGVGESNLPAFSVANLGIQKGFINCSWHQARALQTSQGQSLIQLHFTALEEGLLSNALSIDKQTLVAEAYLGAEQPVTAAVTIVEPILQFNTALTDQTDWTLYQNQPNPFRNKTNIQFSLPQEQYCQLRVFDTNGQTLYLQEGLWSEGMHQIAIDRQDLPASGLLFYSLESNGVIRSYKMLLVD